MSGHLLSILVLLPLLGGLACLVLGRRGVRFVALGLAGLTFLLSLWAYSLYGQRATPRLDQAWSAPGGLVDGALDRAGLDDKVVRQRFRDALMSGFAPEGLADDLAGVRLAEETLQAAERADDPLRTLRIAQAEALVAGSRAEAATLARSLDELSAELSGLRVAAASPLRAQYAFVESARWIPGLGIHWTLGVDGLSLCLVLLISFLALLCVIHAAFVEESEGCRTRLGLLLLSEGGLIGLFAALDLVVFAGFWLLLLLPGTLLAGGGRDEEPLVRGARFFVPGLLGAAAILFAVLLLGSHTPGGTVNLIALGEYARGGSFPLELQRVAFACLFLGFAVRLPLVPLHGWLASAQEVVPASYGALLHGGLVVSGGYGIVRLAWPLCHDVSQARPVLLAVGALGLVNLLAGGLLTLATRDLRRLVVHVTVAMVGLFLLGLASGTPGGISGAVLELVVLGIASGGACLAAGVLFQRTRETDLTALGGLSRPMPQLSGVLAVLLLAPVGLPGLGGFAAHLLVLLGAWRAGGVPAWSPLLALVGLALLGAGVAWALGRILLGRLWRTELSGLQDLRPWEAAALVPSAAACVLLGVAPRVVLDAVAPSLQALLVQMQAS